ncbi:MAG: Gfo/Idh/MocA family oxidoreductase [Clostridiales Family XIII bacterium]|jgi:predicted dehydrogenase|nr:Gfo/Idh/MocA family oxidoreductase [Clostridiales Family XIII bacterium]
MKEVKKEFLLERSYPVEVEDRMPSTHRWGVLGSGWIASCFTTQVTKAGGHIAAVASRSLAKAEEFQNRFPSIEKAYGSYEELMQDPDIDVIYIATPHAQHYEWAIKCLEHDKPILVEKAFTQNYKQAKEIIDLARERNLFVMEAYWARFLPHIIKVKELISRGEIGDIVQIIADHGVCFPFDPKHRLYAPELAGGALLDLGVYPISFVQFLLGNPTKILSSGSSTPTGVDSNVATIFEYEDGTGPIASLTFGSLASSPITAAICGTKGRIEIHRQFYRPSDFTVYYNDGSTYTYVSKTHEDYDTGLDGLYGMHFEAAEVQRCLSEGKLESSVMPWADTLSVMKIMDEIRGQLDFKLPNE